MPLFSLADAGLHAMGGQITTTSLLTPVTAGAANAVGAWAALHTAVAIPVSGLRVHLGKTAIALAAQSSQTLLDVGVGPSGQEVLAAQDITIGGATAFAAWELPLAVPEGSRIAVRLRSKVASKSVTMGMSVWGGGGGLEGGHKAITYGAVPGSSIGTPLTAPAGTNADAAWTVITTGLTLPIRWLLVGLAGPDTTIATAADHLVTIGAGGAGVETPVITHIPCSVSANEELSYPHPLLFPVSLPAGTRVVARYRGTSIATAARPNITLTGIT